MPEKSLNFPLPEKRWDIFCTVIDNFGDIGVCWRLARQLTQTYQQSVRLWVDDLNSFQAICPAIDPMQAQQIWQNVAICSWGTPFVPVDSADIVVEAFSCQLPESYLQTMAASSTPPVWINLEYLSAEPWVEGCHQLTSPHPTLPLNKYFFFPGFTAQTGGILYEPEQLIQRQHFQQDTAQQNAFWASIFIPPPQTHEKRISLFCYDNPHIPVLLKALASADIPYTCLVPQGPAEKEIATFFNLSHLHSYTAYQQGNLQLYVLPFLEQDRYDQLLWACDINFVRGEDSFIHAQLAARPFIWQIYPQEEHAHHQKLEAFLREYAPHQPVIRHLWQAWNGYPLPYLDAWQTFIHHYPKHQQHADTWAQQLTSQPDLAAKLILFCQNKLK
jgi:uncharacterized repeat protein (TIGR03837 family)